MKAMIIMKTMTTMNMMITVIAKWTKKNKNKLIKKMMMITMMIIIGLMLNFRQKNKRVNASTNR